jgi:preprotein translocase subunit SecA
MKKQQFERIFQNMLNREENKNQSFESLTREEKINFFIDSLNIQVDGLKIASEKEIEISKLSKDLRFELIQKAAAAGNLEEVSKLSLAIGSVKVRILTDFEKATITDKLDYLQKEYLKTNDHLPEKIEVEVLGGQNFRDFVEFAYNMLQTEK